MHDDHTGLWVVVETRQVSGSWDEITGPYRDRQTAHQVAADLTTESRRNGRRDRFDVGYVTLLEDDDA